MQQVQQTLSDILAQLSPIDTAWQDEFAATVISLLTTFPEKESYDTQDIAALLGRDFDAGLTLLRLFVDLSGDEFEHKLRTQIGPREGKAKGIGVTRFRADPAKYLQGLQEIGVLEAIITTVQRPTTWADVLIERLKSGRGSAIKGQRRGRVLEDFTEGFVKRVFGEGQYETRCRFAGESGQSTEKTDFAIPSKQHPQILIEAKAYGATGSKQTDVLGDMSRIVQEKRHDTMLLLVTDGVTWRARVNDLRKLVDLQNRGRIARIYTVKMAQELEQD